MLSVTIPTSTPLHTLHHELILRMFDYLTIQDLLRMEASSKWMNAIIQSHWKGLERRQKGGSSIAFTAKDRICRYKIATAKVMECLERNKQSILHQQHSSCPGCCTCPHYDPTNVHFDEYFLWIGATTRKDKSEPSLSTSSEPSTSSTDDDNNNYDEDSSSGSSSSNSSSSSSNNNNDHVQAQQPPLSSTCYWRGFVRSTSSSLLLSNEIQKELVAKSPEFSDLLDLLTETSNASKILDRKITPGLKQAIQRVTSAISIHVIALAYDTHPTQPWIIMEATPSSKHLQIHWDDSSYNPEYASLAWLLSISQTANANNDNNNNNRHQNENGNNNQDNHPHQRRGGGCCMHLWVQVSNNRPAALLRVNIDKCNMEHEEVD